MIPGERLQVLLEEATVDCYDEEEEFMGVLISVDENVNWPLRAQLTGMPVEVLGLDEDASNLRRGIQARIRRQGKEYRASLSDLTFGDMDETSAEWLAMYRWWADGWQG
jgi:hypothetical protein